MLVSLEGASLPIGEVASLEFRVYNGHWKVYYLGWR